MIKGKIWKNMKTRKIKMEKRKHENWNTGNLQKWKT